MLLLLCDIGFFEIYAFEVDLILALLWRNQMININPHLPATDPLSLQMCPLILPLQHPDLLLEHQQGLGVVEETRDAVFYLVVLPSGINVLEGARQFIGEGEAEGELVLAYGGVLGAEGEEFVAGFEQGDYFTLILLVNVIKVSIISLLCFIVDLVIHILQKV